MVKWCRFKRVSKYRENLMLFSCQEIIDSEMDLMKRKEIYMRHPDLSLSDFSAVLEIIERYDEYVFDDRKYYS